MLIENEPFTETLARLRASFNREAADPAYYFCMAMIDLAVIVAPFI